VHRNRCVVLLFLIVMGCLAAPAAAQSSEPPAHDGVHIVHQGETLFSIAQRYGLTVNGVAHVNGISDPRRIYVGQRLIIPNTDQRTTLRPTSPHLVQAGDTLGSIALRCRTTYQDLMFINRMVSPSALHAGQVISVPMSSEEAMGGAFDQAAFGLGSIVVVHPDDTLFRIALRHGVSTWDIAEANHGMDPALIFPGLEVVIPGRNSDLLPAPFVDIRVRPLPVRQGEAVLVGVKTSRPVTLTGSLFGHEAPFFEEDDVYYGLVGVHVFAEPGLYDLDLSALDPDGYVTQVTSGVVVESGKFAYERINLPVGRRQLLDPAVISSERQRLEAVIHLASPERFWNGGFQRPCAGMVSSYFGSHRSYDGGPYTSYGGRCGRAGRRSGHPRKHGCGRSRVGRAHRVCPSFLNRGGGRSARRKRSGTRQGWQHRAVYWFASPLGSLGWRDKCEWTSMAGHKFH